jgi:hypothetical protein
MLEGELPRSAKVVLARIHPAALGTAMGSVLALWVSCVTLWMAMAGDHMGKHALALLSQFWPGYRVSPAGAVLGLVYGLALGFVAGYGFATARNGIIRLYLAYLRRRAEQQQLQDILDRLG